MKNKNLLFYACLVVMAFAANHYVKKHPLLYKKLLNTCFNETTTSHCIWAFGDAHAKGKSNNKIKTK